MSDFFLSQMSDFYQLLEADPDRPPMNTRDGMIHSILSVKELRGETRTQQFKRMSYV